MSQSEELATSRIVSFERDFTSRALLPKDFPKKSREFTDKLAEWTKRIDLVAPASFEQLYLRHVIDSLAALYMLEQAELLKSRVVDVGSGAGLPGLVFALARPTLECILVEPRDKRVSFLKEMRRLLGLENVEIVKARIEEFSATTTRADGIFVARALGMEAELLKAAQNCLLPPHTTVVLAGPSWSGAAERIIAYEVAGLGERKLAVLATREAKCFT